MRQEALEGVFVNAPCWALRDGGQRRAWGDERLNTCRAPRMRLVARYVMYVTPQQSTFSRTAHASRLPCSCAIRV